MSAEKWRRSPRMPAQCPANLADLKPQTETSQARAQLLVLVVIKQGLAVGHLATSPARFLPKHASRKKVAPATHTTRETETWFF